MCNGSLSSCYFVGTVSGSSNTGAVCGYIDRATITNCFFNSDIFSGVAVEKNDGGTIKNVVAKTTKQFKSGEGMGIAIKADKSTSYAVIKKVMDTLRDIDEAWQSR